MPIPRWVAHINRSVTNRLTRPVAGHLPGFGNIIHSGLRTHRVYRTPVNVFATEGGYVVALTYGTGSQWVRNVLAAGECELETHGRTEHLAVGSVVHDESRDLVPWPVRQVLRILDVADFLILTRPAA